MTVSSSNVELQSSPEVKLQLGVNLDGRHSACQRLEMIRAARLLQLPHHMIAGIIQTPGKTNAACSKGTLNAVGNDIWVFGLS